MSALHCVYHRLPIVYIRLKTTLLSLPGLPAEQTQPLQSWRPAVMLLLKNSALLIGM